VELEASRIEDQVEHVHLMSSSWTVGIDLGQVNDPTAICLVQRLRHFSTEPLIRGGAFKPGLIPLPVKELGEPKPGDLLRIQGLRRLQLGLTYTEQAHQICVLLADPRLQDAQVFVDQTGVGRAVCDLLKSAGIRHKPVTITGGTEVTQRDDGGWAASKLQLISRLQAALHSGELKIPEALPDAAKFIQELQDFRVSWSEAGNVRFGARVGQHDDLVLAAALAVFGATGLAHDCKVTPLAFGLRGTY
jgi:hypothetical protein